VHHRLAEYARAALAQKLGNALRIRALLRRRQHQSAPRAQVIHLRADRRERAGTEHDATG